MDNKVIEKYKFLLEDKEKKVGEIEIENDKILSSKGLYHGVPYTEKYFYTVNGIECIIFKYQKDGIRNEISYKLDEENNRIKIAEKQVLQNKKVIKEYDFIQSLGVVVIKNESATPRYTTTSEYSYSESKCKITSTNDKYNLKVIKEYSLDQFKDLEEGIIKDGEEASSESIYDLDTGFLYYNKEQQPNSNYINISRYHPEKGRISNTVLDKYLDIETTTYLDGSGIVIQKMKSINNTGDIEKRSVITKDGEFYKEIIENTIEWGGLTTIINKTKDKKTKTLIIKSEDTIAKHFYEWDRYIEDYVLKYSNLYIPYKKQMAIHKRVIYTEDKITTLKYNQRTVGSCTIEKSVYDKITKETQHSKVKFGTNIFTCIDPDKVKIAENISTITLFNRPIIVKER